MMSATSMVPVPVRRATTAMYVLSVLFLVGYLLGALGFVVGGLSVLRRGDQQGKGLAVLGVAIAVAVVAVLIVFVWLTANVRRGRSWARVLASVLLVVGLVGVGLDSWRSLTADPTVVPLLGIVEFVLMLVALALLWVPVSAREYFADGGHRRMAANA